MKAVASVACLAIAMSCGNAVAYNGPPGSVTFQGEGIVESVSGACDVNGDSRVGDYFTAIYLYGGTSDHADSLFLNHDAYVYVIQPTSGTSLNGSNTTTAVFINDHAEVNNRSGSSQFTIGSVGGLPTSQAVNLKLVGTITDFIDPGCVINFHAVLVTKPS